MNALIKKILCPVTSLLLLGAGSIDAGWELTNGFYGGHVQSFVHYGDTLFAATWGAGVFVSTDSGTTWSGCNSGLTELHVSELEIFGDTLFAGTNAGRIFRTSIRKIEWTSRFWRSSAGRINCFAVVDSTLYFGTTRLGVCRLTDRSAGWETVNIGIADSNITALAAVDTLLFAGVWSGGLYISSDKGTTWAVADGGLPNPTVLLSLAAIHGTLLAGVKGGTYYSTDKGASWLQTKPAAPATLLRSFTSINDTCYGVTLTSEIHRSIDSGITWSKINSSVGSGQINQVIGFGGALDLGTASGIYRSTDKGISWTATNVGLAAIEATSLLSKDGVLFAGCREKGVFLSSDHGNSWTPANDGVPNLSVTELTTNGATLFGVAGKTNCFMFSVNSGAKWTEVGTYHTTTTFVNVLVPIGNELLGGTQEAGVFRASKGNSGWTTDPSGLSGIAVRKLMVKGDTVFAGTEDDGAFISRDKGKTWTGINAGLECQNCIVTSFTLCGNTVFSGTFRGLFRFDENSASWTTVIPEINVLTLTAVNDRIFAGVLDSGVCVLEKSGTAWTKVNSGLPNLAVLSLAVQDSILFAGTSAGGVWRRPLSEMIGSTAGGPERQHTVRRESIGRCTISGNKDNIAISFFLAKAGMVTAKVFDLSGRMAAVVVSGHHVPGSYHYHYDRQSFSRGCYVVSLQYGTKTALRYISLY